MSPTARTLEALRRDGYTPAVVERFIPQARTRVDLWNVFDVLAVRGDVPGALGVQATSASNHSSRVKKLLQAGIIQTWLKAGNRAEVHSWGKIGARWTCRKTAPASPTPGPSPPTRTPDPAGN